MVENTFTSIPEMAKVLLRWRVLHYLPLGFYKNKVKHNSLCFLYLNTFTFTVSIHPQSSISKNTNFIYFWALRHFGTTAYDVRTTQ